jgi:hypothetical protein
MSALVVAVIAGVVLFLLVVGYVSSRRRRQRGQHIHLLTPARVRPEIPDDEFWKRWTRRQTRARRRTRRRRVHS